jgi:hypothetical protein
VQVRNVGAQKVEEGEVQVGGQKLYILHSACIVDIEIAWRHVIWRQCVAQRHAM